MFRILALRVVDVLQAGFVCTRQLAVEESRETEVMEKKTELQFFAPVPGTTWTDGSGRTYLLGKAETIKKDTVFRVEMPFPRSVPKPTEIKLPIPKVEQIGIDEGVWCEQCRACWCCISHSGDVVGVIRSLLIAGWFLTDGGNKWACRDCLAPKGKSR